MLQDSQPLNFSSETALSGDSLSSHLAGQPIVVQAGEGGASVTVPMGEALLAADFARSGRDLLINQGEIIVRDYFAGEVTPHLLSDHGKRLEGQTVSLLAGSQAPSMYAGPTSEAEAIGQVEKVSGEVTVKRGDGSTETLKLGDPVFMNDIIQTGSGGGIGIRFNDDSVFSLNENARMTLDELVYDPDTGEGSSSVTVVKGMFKFVSGGIAEHNPGDMVIKTPVATIGIRGTTGGGMVQGEGAQNNFFLAANADGTHGKFDVVTDNGSMTIDQPFMKAEVTSINDNFSGQNLQPMNPQEMQAYESISNVTPPGKYEPADAREASHNAAESAYEQRTGERLNVNDPGQNNNQPQGQPQSQNAPQEGAPQQGTASEGQVQGEGQPQAQSAQGEPAAAEGAGNPEGASQAEGSANSNGNGEAPATPTEIALAAPVPTAADNTIANGNNEQNVATNEQIIAGTAAPNEPGNTTSQTPPTAPAAPADSGFVKSADNTFGRPLASSDNGMNRTSLQGYSAPDASNIRATEATSPVNAPVVTRSSLVTGPTAGTSDTGTGTTSTAVIDSMALSANGVINGGVTSAGNMMSGIAGSGLGSIGSGFGGSFGGTMGSMLPSGGMMGFAPSGIGSGTGTSSLNFTAPTNTSAIISKLQQLAQATQTTTVPATNTLPPPPPPTDNSTTTTSSSTADTTSTTTTTIRDTSSGGSGGGGGGGGGIASINHTMTTAGVYNAGLGNDTVIGTAGADTIDGGAGSDSLMAGGGNDHLNGGLGADILNGGAGNDTFNFVTVFDSTDGNTDVIQDFVSGNDKIAINKTIANSSTEFSITYDSIRDRTVVDHNSSTFRIELVGNHSLSGTDFLFFSNNNAPVVGTAIPNQNHKYDTAFTYAVPAATFNDPDAGDTLIYSATLADGNPLPAWLSFNGATSTFNIAAGLGVIGNYNIKVTATDNGSLTTNTTFLLTVEAPVTNGSAAADNLVGTTFHEIIYGFSGNDTIFGKNGNDTIDGGDGNDNLLGEQDNDSIQGGAGFDSINGGQGNDTLMGGLGHDTLIGDEAGGVGEDSIFGGDGDDTIVGVGGNDILMGDTGHDNLNGDSGNDTLLGGANNDILQGGVGDDTLDGGTEDDILIGEQDSNTITTGSGLDIIRVNNNTIFHDVITDFSIGNDYIVIEGSATARPITLGTSTGNLVITFDGYPDSKVTLNGLAGSFASFEQNIYYTVASSTDDRLMMDYTINTLNGASGNDIIKGSRRNDILQGDIGNDSLFGLDGHDLLQGGDGADSIDGGSADDVLYGDIGADILLGGDSNDTLCGGMGLDNLTGGTGKDIFLYRNLGESNSANLDVIQDFNIAEGDKLFFFRGIFNSASSNTPVSNASYVTNNVTFFQSGGYTYIYGSSGFQVKMAGNINLTSEEIVLFDYVGDEISDTLTLTAGTSPQNGYGSAGNDTITGNAGNNFLYGGHGNDSLISGGGLDTLHGGIGMDTITVDGNATLNVDGGADRDTLILTNRITLNLSDPNLKGIETIDISGGSGTSITGLSLATIRNLVSPEAGINPEFVLKSNIGDPSDNLTVTSSGFSDTGIVEGDYRIYSGNDGTGTITLKIHSAITVT
jgi:Ca2+-binding RTX toxin-like protein